MKNKYFTVRAQVDGLWLEIKGERHHACLNLTVYPSSIEGKAAMEVWTKMREETCARCGENIEDNSADGCRDPDCPVPVRGEQ